MLTLLAVLRFCHSVSQIEKKGKKVASTRIEEFEVDVNFAPFDELRRWKSAKDTLVELITNS